jgi:hypothetical protein
MTNGKVFAAALLMTMTGLFAVAGGFPALAAGAKPIGAFKDWSAHLFAEKKGKICYMHSRPKKSEGNYTKRGDTYVQVTHRASDKTRNEVSVTAGYAYRKGSEVVMIIDGKQFSLFTDDDTAWGGDAKVDSALVAAMKAGATMIVKGTSARGTLTTDTYSLAGFTAAHKAIDKACDVQ